MAEILQSLITSDFLRQAWDKHKFGELTAIQQQAIPAILSGKDIIAESPTGTGKTLAYLLPLLQRLEAGKKDIQAVILAPTRELVMQIHQQIQNFTAGSELTGAAFIGGADIKRQIEKLKQHPQIAVGTPGRILELVKAKKMKMHEVKSIVIDEADQILELGIMGTVQDVIKTTLKDRQLMFFSATISDKVKSFGEQVMKQPEFIRISRQDMPPSQVIHMYVVCERRDKIDILRRIMKMQQLKAIAFVNGTGGFTELVAKLEYKGIPLKVLHGELDKTEREAIIKNFRAGKFPLLLATDVAARGLDFPDLSHVVNFDLPDTADQYVHRAGRTGRMGAAGTVISIITPHQENVLQKFSRQLGIPISRKYLFKGEFVDKKPASAKTKAAAPLQKRKNTPGKNKR